MGRPRDRETEMGENAGRKVNKNGKRRKRKYGSQGKTKQKN